MNYTIRQGEDILLEVPVYNETTGAAIDLSSAEEVIMTLTAKNITLDKFSVNTKTGYQSMSVKSGAGNEHILEAILSRAYISAYTVGKVQINVLTEYTDSSVTLFRDEYIYTDAITVLTGYTKSVEL